MLLLDEPTRGIDVGAKAEIYALVRSLAEEGIAVVFASSDLPEVVGLSHRVLVCRSGNVAGGLFGDEIEPEAIMHLALGTPRMTAITAPRRRDVAWIAHSGLAAWVIVAALIVGLTIKDPRASGARRTSPTC